VLYDIYIYIYIFVCVCVCVCVCVSLGGKGFIGEHTFFHLRLEDITCNVLI
jgi:hypothetical protein